MLTIADQPLPHMTSGPKAGSVYLWVYLRVQDMRYRFHHILVPVDLGERNRAALDIALDMAAQSNARVTLLHVIQTIGGADDDDLTDEESRKFYDDLRARVESELTAMAKPFRDAGIDTVVRTPIGDRLQEILSCSRDDADLLIMTSHRVNPDDLAASWGTLSYRVTVVCDTPIFLVKQA